MTIKRTGRPYFVLHGNICALHATKDHVNAFTYDLTVPDPVGVINQGHRYSTARAIQVYREDAIDGSAIVLVEGVLTVLARGAAVKGSWFEGRTQFPANPISEASYPVIAVCQSCYGRILLADRLQMQWRHVTAKSAR